MMKLWNLSATILWNSTTLVANTERFLSASQREWVNNHFYRICHKAMEDVREYVAAYYNATRPHSPLGYNAPVEFEKVLSDKCGLGLSQ